MQNELVETLRWLIILYAVASIIGSLRIRRTAEEQADLEIAWETALTSKGE
jgi:hypothetical protein